MTLAHLGAEAYRLRLLTQLERELEADGFTLVAGVDEAGRGSLAGPVVAAAVIPAPGRQLAGVDDSKRLTPSRRERLAERIRESAVAWRVEAVPASAIDRINILEATRHAMKSALLGLEPRPDLALVDAVSLPRMPFPCMSVVRGDSLSYAVACASILAKVERDSIMKELHSTYPFYGFDANKGYAAQGHLEALARIGPCPDHRLTFRSVLPVAGGS